MARLSFAHSLLPLTFLAFVLGCSPQETTRPIVKKTSAADSKKNTNKNSKKDDEESKQGEDDDTDNDSEEMTGEDSGMEEEETMTPAEPTPMENVASLNNFRWEMPCEKMDGDQLCFSNVKVDSTKTIAGKTSDLYEVELKFRGVVEPMKYKDGKREGDRFYIGGVPDDPTYNIYSIEVSSPKQIYYLNWADGVGHDTFSINYTTKIKINGGATVHLIGDGQNDKMIANFKNAMAPEIPGLPEAGNKGQFIQMNVVSATLSN